MVPRDGFEPSTRGFSVLMAQYSQLSNNQQKIPSIPLV